MVKTIGILRDELKEYSNINMKVKSMCDKGELFPLVKKLGLYETDRTVSGYCLAKCIYPNSYLSFEFALSWHSLIPEAVYTFTSASYERRKRKIYTNAFGTFTYRDIPSKVFPFEVDIYNENGYSYWIATPEKAICDELYIKSPCNNKRELENLLFYDLRIDEDDFWNLDMNVINELADYYHKKNHKLLKSLIRKEVKNG